MMRHLLSILTCLAAFAASSQAAPVYPSNDEFVKLLTSSRFEELDRRIGAIQADYRDGRITDVELRLAFKTFRMSSDDLAPHFRAWLKHSPKSYAAHLTQGIYYLVVGGRARGAGFYIEIDPSRLPVMHAAYSFAAQEFNASSDLDRKPLLSYVYSMAIAELTGDGDRANAMLKRGLAVDPTSFVIREQYMTSLQTRWHGNTEQMRAFLNECSDVGLSSAQLRTLKSLVREDEGWVKQYREKDHMTAIAMYQEAADLDPTRSYCKSCGPLQEGAELAFRHGLHKKAIELYTRVLAQNPDDTTALDNRGYSYLMFLKEDLAAEDFSRAAKLGDAYAQTMLAKMMLHGHPMPKNGPEAMRLLELAAAQNYEEAKKMLEIERNRTEKSATKMGSRP